MELAVNTCKPSFLVVDDEKSLCDIIAYHVQPLAKEVITAHNGIEALEKLNSHKIDIVITDLLMPGMDGITLLEQMEEKYPDIISIILTAFNDKDFIQNGMRAGACDFLEKPIRREALLERISTAIKRKMSKESKSILSKRLEEQKNALVQKDVAFREVLSLIETEKVSVKENIAVNIEKKLKPMLQKLRKLVRTDDLKDNVLLQINDIENALNKIDCDFYKKLNQLKIKLSPSEMKICQHIHSGLLIKEVAGTLNLSISTVKNHIRNIKRKLSIDKSTMLKTYLNQMI